MKIIGTVGTDRYDGPDLLIQATKDEVARILGQYSASQMKERGIKESDLKVGFQINVDAAWSRLYWLERRRYELEQLTRACRSVIEGIEGTAHVFNEIDPKKDVTT
jgi:hypothetical protein